MILYKSGQHRALELWTETACLFCRCSAVARWINPPWEPRMHWREENYCTHWILMIHVIFRNMIIYTYIYICMCLCVYVHWATLAYERVLWHGQVRASRTIQWDNKEKVAVCMSRSQLHEAVLWIRFLGEECPDVFSLKRGITMQLEDARGC